MLVAAFTTAAAYAFWRYVSAPPGRLALAGFYTAVAFAVFSRGSLPRPSLAPYLSAGTGSFGETVLWGDWLSWYLGRY